MENPTFEIEVKPQRMRLFSVFGVVFTLMACGSTGPTAQEKELVLQANRHVVVKKNDAAIDCDKTRAT